MKKSLFLFALLLAPFTRPTTAAIHGENDIWVAPDNLSCLPWTFDSQTNRCKQAVDKQLSNLIKRTGMTYASSSQGTAFLLGQKCDWIVSTKHTINHLNGKQRAPQKTQFFRNILEHPQIKKSSQTSDILLINNDVEPITDLTDRKLTQLSKSALDQQLTACPEVLLQTARELKKNISNIESCLIMSFNQDLGNPNFSKRGTMTLRTSTGLEEFSSRTRGITSCKITGFAFDGMIETDCDSTYASSGSPFFCKAKGIDKQWQLTGTLFADTCKGYTNYNNCLNPAKAGIKGHSTLMIPITEKLVTSIRKIQQANK